MPWKMKASIISGIILGLFFATNSFAAEPTLSSETRAIEAESHSVIGVAAIHIETNERFSYNGNVPFSMASTVKIPVAMTFLHQVDEGKISLNEIVNLSLEDLVPGSGDLYYKLDYHPLSLSYYQLLRHMLISSDNTASDTILKKVGGPPAVMQRMRQLGLNNILVTRSIRQDFVESEGGDQSLLEESHTHLGWQKTFDLIPVNQRAQAWRQFENDPRDTTTPNDMALLLAKLYKGEALSPSSAALMLQIMKQCRTGRASIKGLLPPNTPVAHKTGSWFIVSPKYLSAPQSRQLLRFVGDVGIITLPNNKGHIAIAVYVKSTAVHNIPRFRAIAEESRMLYDYFLDE